ncbi:MAG: polyphosphate kinase 2 [Planctomycetales bacterium]
MGNKKKHKKKSPGAAVEIDGTNGIQSTPPADRPYPYDKRLAQKKYEKTLVALQIELLKVQNWVEETGERLIVVFEGRDAAGKGGTIKRFREHLNPRGARIVALPKPNNTEKGQWYFQRYIGELPTEGEMVFFDRSWYNRAGVEPVMGFCDADQYARFMHQVPSLERALTDSGIRLFKFWFDVSRDVQKRRIKSRKTDPLKHWKLSPMDDKAMQKWDAYTRARDAMFLLTDTREAPWTVIRSDDKRRARIAAMLTLLDELPYPDKELPDSPDPLIVGPAREMISLEGRFLFDED